MYYSYWTQLEVNSRLGLGGLGDLFNGPVNPDVPRDHDSIRLRHFAWLPVSSVNIASIFNINLQLQLHCSEIFSIRGDFIGTLQWQNILAHAYLCCISKSYKFGRTLAEWSSRISNLSIFNSVTVANTSSNAIPKG